MTPQASVARVPDDGARSGRWRKNRTLAGQRGRSQAPLPEHRATRLTIMTDAELAVVVREGFAESRHRGYAVAVDPDGRVIAELGDSQTPMLPRSSLKPFQAAASLRAGAPLEDETLAIAAASHGASPDQLDAVRCSLARAGLTEDSLGCPPAMPHHPETLRQATIESSNPRRLWHNCSGKHAGMLNACVVSGWDPSGYLAPDGPYQRLVRETVTELVGPVHASVTDGCGAPNLAVTLRGLATGFARLFTADDDAARVAAAMQAHPVLVGGDDAPDTLLMQAIPGLVAKRGAEGVLAASIAGVGGVAVKASDGAMRPAPLVVLHLLAALGVDVSAARHLGDGEVLGGGKPVGKVEPSEALARLA